MTHREPYAGTGSGPCVPKGTTGDSEWIVPPLNGGCTVDIGNEKYRLPGTDSVFSGVADFTHAPRDARAQNASGAGGRFALAGAKCERRLPARYGPAPEVPHLHHRVGRGRGAVRQRRIRFSSAHPESTGGYR